MSSRIPFTAPRTAPRPTLKVEFCNRLIIRLDKFSAAFRIYFTHKSTLRSNFKPIYDPIDQEEPILLWTYPGGFCDG